MARQFIYHMQGLTKTYPTGKKVLDNVNLSFYPDAKIGVLGINGSGKSTLLRIMAGIDKEFTGEGFVGRGRPRRLSAAGAAARPVARRARQCACWASRRKKAILDRYNELAMNYSDETADEMTQLQDEIEAQGLWDLDSQVEHGDGRAAAARPTTGRVDKLSGGERRRVALCRLLLEKPDLLLLDEPTNHLDAETVNWLEGHLRNYPGAILIVTHDRYFLDNVTGWILELDRGRGIPLRGQLLLLPQAEGRSGLRRRSREDAARQRTIAARSRMDGLLAQGAPGEIQGAHPALRGARRQAGGHAAPTARRSSFRSPSGSATMSSNSTISRKGFGDKLLIDDLTFKLPPGGIVGVIGPNGAGKTTLFRMITGQEKPDKGTITVGDQRQARLCRPVARRARSARRTSGRKSPAAHEVHLSRQARDQLARLCSAPSTSRAPTSRRRSASCPAASATACISPRC